MTRKNIFFLLIITLFTALPNIVVAQGFDLFTKQKVAIFEIVDNNNRPLSVGATEIIYRAYVDALVNSNKYEVVNINWNEIKNSIINSGKQYDITNVCKSLNGKADYMLVTSVSSSTNDIMADNVKMLFTTSLYGVKTASKQNSEWEEAYSTQQSVKEAIFKLVSSLLKVNKSSTNTSSQQSSYSSNTNNYSNNQSYGSVSNKINGHEYVDLGLSVKWATCNIGAYYPDNPGKHYAWGETTTKSSYTRDNSKTYGVSMGDISGNPNYDVARATWGGTWRLPTSEEFEELIQCCTWTWTTENGTKGYKVTSRRNGNSIFLPAAGYRYDSSLGYAGSYGDYWSSSPYGSSSAYGLYFNSSECKVDWNFRYSGYSVRAVSE